ncbi:MAG TPA: methylated-DNA--[protein]-cysteine S-methyltransferase [Gallionella sp.]|nr:methylated-DNA--[protein]-cysteine S-methyltransferase [Gallionella sp.]
MRYHRTMDYQAKLRVPFGVLGIRCSADALVGIDFLAVSESAQTPTGEIAAMACEQLRGYFDDPQASLTVPLDLRGTAHRHRVWQAILHIPCGQTRSYGELAAALHSGAQAVGQACGVNPVPIVVPCHRVIAKAGLGGFMQSAGGATLDIKRWLLKHEGVL